jgi:hypothetical protein
MDDYFGETEAEMVDEQRRQELIAEGIETLIRRYVEHEAKSFGRQIDVNRSFQTRVAILELSDAAGISRVDIGIRMGRAVRRAKLVA